MATVMRAAVALGALAWGAAAQRASVPPLVPSVRSLQRL
eukprot:COSAG04_NODE_842_length_9945_cov_4.243043_1_plen_38_part_10